MAVPKLRFKEFKDEWKKKKIGNIVSEIVEKTNDIINYPLWSLTIEDGVTPKTERYERGFLVKKEDNFKIVHFNNFVYNPMNLRFGAIAYHTRNIDISVSGYYNIFEINNLKTIGFWDNYFKCPVMIKRYNNIATGSLIEKKRVHYSQFIELLVPQPSVEEQITISQFFISLNKKIELQKQKIEALKIYKKGLIQKNFESKNGERIKISEILEEVINKTTENNQYDVISSTKDGLFLQSEYFNRSIASDNNIGYKILKKNQIVLSPQNLWMGNINYNNKYEIGMVSPSYKIFNINKKFDKDYISNLLKTNKAIYYYTINSEQGASIVRRNLNIESFYEINFVIPDIAEQNKKGKIINKIAQKIDNEEKKYQKLDKFKKGLLQKMFI